MATAIKKIIPPKPVADTVEFVLTLSLEEAETLKGITAHIGGPMEGRRKHLTDIGIALYEAGVRGSIAESEIEPANRAIYFTSNWDKR